MTALPTVGAADRAEALVRAFPKPADRAQVLTGLAVAVASDDVDRAVRLANEAEVVSRAIRTPEMRDRRGLVVLATALARAGDLDRSLSLANQADRLFKSTPHLTWSKDESLAGVVEALAATGEVAQAEELARRISDPSEGQQALRVLVDTVAASGEIDRAVTLAHTLSKWSRPSTVQALVSVVKAVAATGDVDRARALAGQVEALTRSSTGPDRLDAVAVVEAMSASGDIDRAEQLTRHITEPRRLARALVVLVKAVVATGDVDRARTLLASHTETVTCAIEEMTELDRRSALANLAEAMIAAGEVYRAESIARSIRNPYWQAMALTALVKTVAAQDRDRARALADDALAVARTAIPQVDMDDRLIALVEAMGAAGAHSWAHDVASSLPDPDKRAQALTVLAKVSSSDRNRLLAQAFRIGHWSIPLAELVWFEPAVAARIADELLELDTPHTTLPHI